MNERGDIDFTGKFKKRWEPLSICSPEEANLQFSHSVVSHSLWPHGHARLPYPSPIPRACSNSCPSSRWCHPAISSFVFPFSSCLHRASIRAFSNESVLYIRWPKYWSFSFNISPSNEHPGLISFRMDCLDLLAVQVTLKSLVQHHIQKQYLDAISKMTEWPLFISKANRSISQ